MEQTVVETLSNLLKSFGTTTEEKQELRKCLLDKITEVFDDTESSKKKPVRVYVDGCFDITHSGHFNAIRQAKKLGDILVAGVHDDEEITRNKGPPVMNNEERLNLVKSCKWVDEVAFGVPYTPTVKLLDELNVDFVVHGDDMPLNAEGVSAYDEVIKAGRIKIVKRTEGISTTTLVGRLLQMSQDTNNTQQHAQQLESIASPFIPTFQRFFQFSKYADKAYQEKTPESVVYIDGAFDLYHIGHVEMLEKAKQLGDFLVVGVHDDKSVASYMGKHYPVVNLHERVLNVMSNKDTDEVVLGAPRVITKEMISTLNIKVVVSAFPESRSQENDPYKIAKELGIYVELTGERNLTTQKIVERIIENKQKYEAIYAKKKKKEESYWSDSNEYRKNIQEL